VYKAERGEVFLETEDVRLEDSGNGGLVTQLGLGIGGRLGEHIDQDLSRIDAAAAGPVARGIKAWLAARPVYRFKDDITGLVLKASVRDIAIEGNTLVIDVSLIKLTTAVATWLFGLAGRARRHLDLESPPTCSNGSGITPPCSHCCGGLNESHKRLVSCSARLFRISSSPHRSSRSDPNRPSEGTFP
jgi:hypothetical protein